ncbi:hypothetical protein TCAL_01906 [Tigriopus californicus]|uniref:WW domain-containing protein n=1 Tax=Tigriopus californicus TaxID=6832 RepID=A0A553P846_TIGCA|nr:WW domain-binding protein 4-like [Tigriopus californicus]TRY73853.1 hypothetical protein TCAL_01906 [Tigriopus californicus]|eukprot:TCALIF_01906-PA protein Name:"Similar to Wbp4 WW domain-binding protein 4 (Mus musculus)" AED:0.01 eAED:0.01 QI:96/1/1/1/0.8/0.83/6/18/337
MTEYWVSQARKFCDTCKCWIADNKSSIEFHESGRKHQLNTEKRLTDIRKRSTIQDKKAEKQAQWIEQMEAAALKDYRNKDLAQGADLSARIFHETKAQREAEKEALTASILAQKAEIQAGQDEKATDLSSCERASSSTSNVSTNDPMPGSSCLQTVVAPKSGTPWHKDPKKWFEAVSEQGHQFFWHVETKESRWDVPSEGFLSIAEQAEIKKKKEAAKAKREVMAQQSKAIHGEHKQEYVSPVPLGPNGKPQPYGSWQAVESVDPDTFDYQTPQVKAAPQAAATLHNDRDYNFKTKATPSLGGTASTNLTSSTSGIVFKKRKVNAEHKKNVRRRTDE